MFVFACGDTEKEIIEKAIQYRTTGKYAKAEQLLRDALKTAENEVIYKELGNVYLLGIENLDEAEKFYRRSLQINPSYINSLHNMGLVYLKRFEQSQDASGNGDDAMLETASKFLERALKINPQFLLSRQELAKYYFYKKDYANAIKEIDSAIQQDTRNARGYSIAGQIYLKGKNDAQKALSLFEEAYALNREDTDTLLLLTRTTKILNQTEKNAYYLSQFKELMKRNGYGETDIEKIIGSNEAVFRTGK